MRGGGEEAGGEKQGQGREIMRWVRVGGQG